MRKILAVLLLLATPAGADTFTSYVTRQPLMSAPFQTTDYLPMVRNGIPYKVSLTSIQSTLNIHFTGPTGSFGPSGCGTVLDGWTFNCIAIDGDSVIPISPVKSLLTLSYTVNGGTGSGNPTPLNAITEVTAVPSTISPSTFFGATQLLGIAYVPSGGTIGTNLFTDTHGLGNVFGNGIYAALGGHGVAATGWHTLTGEEIDIKTYAGATVEGRVGINIVSGPDSATAQGSLVDAALVIDNGGRGGPTGTPVGWQNAIQIGYWNESNNNPISAGGRVLTTFTGVTTALDTGIDISGTWASGAGFTYTGDFIKFNSSNHWTGAGQIVAEATGINHDFVRSDAGLISIFENIGGAGSIAIGSKAAAQRTSLFLFEAGTAKWEIAKETDNSFYLFDTGQAKKALTIGVSVAGQIVLGESGGSQLTLAPAGGATLTGIATSGDGTGLFVCQNASDGKLYRKSTCP